jgi:hypothetical protein
MNQYSSHGIKKKIKKKKRWLYVEFLDETLCGEDINI